jgi:methylated-DNA-protein-cysteine methyltransferase-like protein
MPPKSIAFEKIRSDSLSAVSHVPSGRVTTFKEVGRLLDVMPRHIAYILATLSEEERQTIPWHRIVSDGGALSKKQIASYGKEQIRRLRDEGVRFSTDGRILDWESVEWTWAKAQSNIGSKPRGPYSDPNTPLLFPENRSRTSRYRQ